MSEEILANVTPQETRVALIENGVLQEVYLQRSTHRGVVGNVYLGQVQRVLPGMQAAFVDIGLERTAFLHVADIAQPPAQAEGEAVEMPPPQSLPEIQRLLREGDTVLVQVIKDPISTKGARLSTNISIPSRYLVLLPHCNNIGISARIEDAAERDRLKNLIESIRLKLGIEGGFIVRTVGEGASEEDLLADMQFLDKLWGFVRVQAEQAEAGSMVYGDLPLVMRMLRDLLGADVDRLRIDSRENWEQVVKFAQRFMPEVVDRIELYKGESPIFDLYGAEDELNKALSSRVPLKSGGYLIVEQTEAMVTIDVNTGGFVGTRNPEETIFKTNLEAAQAIARQLRLRNLGGIIIIDFIDMQGEDHRRQVLAALERHTHRDPAKTVITGISPLGLVEMTRKRTRESMEQILCESCQHCGGRGHVKSVETVCHEIMREVMRSARQFQASELLVLANPDVIAMLLDELSSAMGDLENFIGRPIRLQEEALYQQEAFDVVIV